MNINEYRQGLMDLAGNGMDFHAVIRRVQEAVSAIRLAESKGKDVEWLKEFYDFAMAEIKKDMAKRQNHFDRIKREMTLAGRLQKQVEEARKACPHCGKKMTVIPEHHGRPGEPGSVWACRSCRFSEYNEASVSEILQGLMKKEEA
jgi:ribosomal protein S27AE